MIRTTMTALMITATIFFTIVLRASDPAAEKKLQQAIDFLESKGDLARATPLFEQVSQSSDRELAARSLLYLGQIQERQGKDRARATYQRIIKEFANQRDAAAEAGRRLAGLGDVRSTSNAIVLNKVWTTNIPLGDVHASMAISPDGRYLVAASDAGLLIHDIHDVSLNKDRYLRSTPSRSDGDITNPHFITPDGKRVVYLIGVKGLSEIRTINIDGTDDQSIFKSSEYASIELTAISPDGKLAAVGLVRADSARSDSNGSFWQIGLVSLQTGKLNILTSPGWRDTYVGNFSPDGRWLVYESAASGEGPDKGIYVIAVDGSDQHPLVVQPMTANAPFFSPDGSKVVSVFAPGGFANRSALALYSIPVADGKPLGPPEIVKDGVPPDPDVIGFTRDGALYLREYVNQNSIYVAEVDASTWKLKNPPREVSDPSRHEFVAEPAWSPNGKLLAFVDSGNEKKLVIHDLDSHKERALTTHVTQMSFRGWMPDGKTVLLDGPPTGVRLFDTESQHEKPLSLTITGPVISSSDGKYLFYFRGDDNRTLGQTPADETIHLIRRDLQNGDEKELYRFEGRLPNVGPLAASPDGRSLSFAYAVASKPTSKTVWVLPLSGGEPRPRRLEGVGGEAGRRVPFTWTQDSKAVLFVRSNEIWVQPVDGGQAYSTGIRMDGVDSPSIHPDGSRIAFAARKTSTAVWKLQNLFPLASATK